MERWMRRVSFAVIFSAVVVGCDTAREKPAPAHAVNDRAPLPITIAASATGGMQHEESWFLSINAAGDAALQVGLFNASKKRFTVSADELDDFRKLTLQHEVFTLPTDFGEEVPDDFIRTLSITVGNRSAMLRFLSFDRIGEVSDVKLCKKAVMLRHKVRAWLDDFDNLLDLREYELNCLRAAGAFGQHPAKPDRPQSDPEAGGRAADSGTTQ
jgi:hypothetical protein